jgi:phosphatidylserine/phosphatidylglycerophosphate/cardiolipin synthase-like enzyme
MNAAELDAMLRQFLVDNKLSKAESDALSAWVGKNIQNDHQRAVARSRVFASARQAVTDPVAHQVLTFVEDVLRAVLPMTPTDQSTAADEVFFSPGDACLGAIVRRLRAARKTIDICVFTITDNRISDAILDAHRRGVKLRIITDNDKAYDEGSDIQRFREAKIPVVVDETHYHMHHKFAIFDSIRLINGSYNWTRGAAEMNEENVVDSGDPDVIARFQGEFDQLWAKLA